MSSVLSAEGTLISVFVVSHRSADRALDKTNKQKKGRKTRSCSRLGKHTRQTVQSVTHQSSEDITLVYADYFLDVDHDRLIHRV